MNTNEITALLRSDCRLAAQFCGVYACDRLPISCSTTCSVVVNLDRAGKPGSHWVAVDIKDGVGIYFDSYGASPRNQYVRAFLKRNCTRWSFNTKQFQGGDSKVCGHYCIWFLSEMARGTTMAAFRKQFVSVTPINDGLVPALVSKRYGSPRVYKTLSECQGCIPRSCND